MFVLKTAIYYRPFRSLSQNIIRCSSQDPGIGRRKKMLEVEERELELPDFDDLESDFMDVSKSHKEHLRELEARKERERYLIVKQKYFKEKFPNFLTWYDKEQIRYLYQTDPEEWSIEKLSEGFPALPETIKKIVKSNWTKEQQHKITNHDRSVQKNWQLYKEGKMQDLAPELKEHLAKFTSRELNLNSFNAPEATGKQVFAVKNINVRTEFSEIITSYKNMQKSSTSQIEHKTIATRELPKQRLKETYLTSKSRKQTVTLDHLQNKIKSKIETGKPITDEDKYILVNLKSEKSNEVKKADVTEDNIITNKYSSSSAMQISKKSEKDHSHLNYPEKIIIPKALFKKGFIYKLNDCYYDDDGEFLYRVPGMG